MIQVIQQNWVHYNVQMILPTLGKALLPGEQGRRETEVIGPDLAGC